jgi:hypothetical protein
MILRQYTTSSQNVVSYLQPPEKYSKVTFLEYKGFWYCKLYCIGCIRQYGVALEPPVKQEEVMVVEEKGSNIIYCTNMTRVLAQSLFD